MQLHHIKSARHNQKRKRIGRGGKRGTFSGRGSKGQQARGARLGPDFRGGNRPLWKVFPKRRGARKKTAIKHRFFQVPSLPLPLVLNLDTVGRLFESGEVVSSTSLRAKGLLRKRSQKVKILGRGELAKKISFEGVDFSKSAKEKILKYDQNLIK